MIRDNYIQIPATIPIVENPNNRLALLFKGFYSRNNKFYVVKQIEANVIHVESRQFDYHLKGFAKLVFIATIIGPLFCLVMVVITVSQRQNYRYRLVVAANPLPHAIIEGKPKELDLWPLVKESIEKSKSSAVPLALKFYLTNIVKALQIYLEADPTLANFKKVQTLISEKEMIVFQVTDSLKVPESRKNELLKEFDGEFALLKQPQTKLKICVGIMRSITPGGNWLVKMNNAFCEIIEMLPEHLEGTRKEKEFTELRDAVENLARHAERRVLNNLELTKFRDVYNPIALRLGLPEMELNNFTENDETLAKELQAMENLKV